MCLDHKLCMYELYLKMYHMCTFHVIDHHNKCKNMSFFLTLVATTSTSVICETFL